MWKLSSDLSAITFQLLRTKIDSFRNREDGSMLVLALFLFVAMLMVGGVAVDFMRYETNRVKVQATADTAALAAASLREQGDRKQVVRDHFAAAGLTQYLDDDRTVVDNNLVGESATIRIVTNPRVDTLLTRLVGVDELSSIEVSGAREKISSIEISLVLDISGSMLDRDSGGMRRIDRMKAAARDFVTEVLSDDNGVARTTISIVPYSGSVNPGRTVFELLGGTPWHDLSHCPEIGTHEFYRTGLPNLTGVNHIAHFHTWGRGGPENWGWCPGAPGSIVYHSSSEQDLHDHIDNFEVHDGTGTQYGVVWGTALLDPSGRWLTEELSARNMVDAAHSDRPGAWDDPDVLKVMVLMTDGRINHQWRPALNGHGIFGRNGLYPTEAQQELLSTRMAQHIPNMTQQTLVWPQRAAELFYMACDMAKENGIVVFTIGFEVNSQARGQMQNCASSANRFFDARGAQLNDAFRSIATSITRLRLTQ